VTSFSEFPLRPQTHAALTAMAVTNPTPIQTAALPAMLAGRDVIGQARTGSGKTLAFVVPIVEATDERRRDVQALVLVPTRELAAQVAGVAREIAHGRDVRVLLLIGGMSAGPQKQALLHGVHVVVGTPGRVLDQIKQGNLRLDRLKLLILDEADEMLDRGFARVGRGQAAALDFGFLGVGPIVIRRHQRAIRIVQLQGWISQGAAYTSL